ncbi:MAG TPA: hypothetical protein VK668_12595 [Mucilaginibacter sp.]|nr:hypothetical protein [Mucilaginibacter sp.]
MNSNSFNLSLIKLLHTAIWIFFNVVIFYLWYAVIADKIDFRVWICVGLILFEGVVLVIFKMQCPLTLLARKYSKSTMNNFDIFLPLWLAKYNKLIYTVIFIIGIAILAFRLVA